MNELNRLSKDQLKELAKQLLEAHESHYVCCKAGEQDTVSGFYQLSGNIIAIRERFELPQLKNS